MGRDSAIPWCHDTFNGWIGCQRFSPGCENCYAETFCGRFDGAMVLGRGLLAGRSLPVWGPAAPRRVTSPANWRKPLAWNAAALLSGQRRRVFTASLSDVFEDFHGLVLDEYGRGVTTLDEARRRLWALMAPTPGLDWLMLTKRAGNVRRMVPASWLERWPPHVWLGFTAEDQRRFDERWPAVRDLPAAVVFCSVEPQLGPVRLPDSFLERGQGAWLICGGESGNGARSFHLSWPRRLRDACALHNVPFFMKQAGARPTQSTGDAAIWGSVEAIRHPAGAILDELPSDLRVREYPRRLP